MPAIASRSGIAQTVRRVFGELVLRVAGLEAVCKDSATWSAEPRPGLGARSLLRIPVFPMRLGARART